MDEKIRKHIEAGQDNPDRERGECGDKKIRVSKKRHEKNGKNRGKKEIGR